MNAKAPRLREINAHPDARGAIVDWTTVDAGAGILTRVKLPALGREALYSGKVPKRIAVKRALEEHAAEVAARTPADPPKARAKIARPLAEAIALLAHEVASGSQSPFVPEMLRLLKDMAHGRLGPADGQAAEPRKK